MIFRLANTTAAKVSLWLFLALLSPVGRAQTLDPGKPPGGNFNLTNFYLGLPVDSSGGTNGNSASIPATQLVAGYSNALYFYTEQDGAMVFWAFVLGATTSGSSYPRSELREQISPPSNSSNWVAYGTHVLEAHCKVTQVPSSGKVIIGQIHGYTGAALPLVKLQYNKGTIEVLIKTNANDDLTDRKYTFMNVGLSNSIHYQIQVVNGLIAVAVNGMTNSLNVLQTDPDWATNTLYFKAGSYCQDNAGTIDEGSRVAFYALERWHGPAITNQPASRSALVNSNASFSVAASGNGLLRYQWRRNDTNDLAGATNATLILTNVQSSSAGGYSVKVTDSLGAVTSLVATLDVLAPPAIMTQPASQTAIAGRNATFSVLTTGSEPLSYQWFFNTNSPLARATNSTLLLTNVGLHDAGMYSVAVTNAAGSVSSEFAALAVNRPPVPGSFSSVTAQEIPVPIPLSELLAIASDPDGDSFDLSGVNPVTAAGGSVLLSSEVIWYTPPAGFVGVDQWSYVLTDGRGASASGAVTVTVIASNAITLTAVAQQFLAGGTFSATFQGVPGLRYVVDRATNLTGPWELGFTNLVAAPEGLFELWDPNSLPQQRRFYRTHYP